MTVETAEPYIETFGCGLATVGEFGDPEHDHDPRIDCKWAYRCGTCGTEDVPCAEHAPGEFAGLMLTDCCAEPPHAKTWVYANDGYGAPCMYCAYEAAEQAHRGCEHSRHRAWRRWKIVHKFAGYGYSLGFVKGSGVRYGGGCRNCLAGLQWGRSSYLLGWDNWKWKALLRCLKRGHLPIGYDACSRSSDGREMDFCVKCSPCPGCATCQPEPAMAVSRG